MAESPGRVTADEGFALLDRGFGRTEHQAGSPVRLPVDQRLDRPLVDILPGPELDDVPVMLVPAGKPPSCRPHLGVGHHFRGLLGENPFKVNDRWPPHDEHPSTMPAPRRR